MMSYPLDPHELLNRVPEELRDERIPVMEGFTARECADHVAETSCLACRDLLQNLIRQTAA